MDSAILRTKLFAPSVPAHFVSRHHLQERLNAAVESGASLLLVCAPAGYGKSTVLAQWLATTTLRTAWLSLDERDNNTHRFWTYVTEALASSAPELAHARSSLRNSESDNGPEGFLTELINAAAALTDHVVLVLDDYHTISASEIHDAVWFLIENAPPLFHLAVGSRTDPPFALGRMRATGKMKEVRVSDLRLTSSEAHTFLTDRMNVQLDDETIAALGKKTEGWITGLQLAALSMEGRADARAFVKQFSGTQSFVLEYLVDEVLDRQSQTLREFLLVTSILPRLCAPLCDALTGNADSAVLLADLVKRNLFLIPLDDHHYWLRYHHLFAEFLKGHLTRERGNAVAALYRSAIDWYRANECTEDALELALNLGDRRLATAIVTENWRRVYHTGRLATAVKWLTSLPGDLLRQAPSLGVAYCWTLFARGQVGRITSYLDSVETSFERMVSAGSLPADHPEYSIINHQVVMLRAVMKRASEKADEAVEDVAAIVPIVEETGPALGEAYTALGFSACYSQLGYSYAASGDLERAEEYLARATPHAVACGNLFTVAHVTFERARIALASGRVDEAESIARRELALRQVPEYADYPAFALIELALAEVLATRRAWEEAEVLLAEALPAAEASGHELYLARGCLTAARVAAGLHRSPAEHLRHAREIAHRIGNALLDAEIERTKSGLEPESKAQAALLEPLSEREIEVLKLICSGKSNQEIADELFVALDTVKRHASNIYGKLGVARRTQAVAEARRLGFV
jgi:LuxR family maltose regulon positive regulatory protein